MFFDRLKIECTKAGTSPTALLKRLGMSTSSVTTWKQGVSPSINTIYKLASALNIDPSQLMENTQKKEESEREQLHRELDDSPEVFLHLLQGAKKLDLDKDDIDMLLDVAARLKRKDKEREKELEKKNS